MKTLAEQLEEWQKREIEIRKADCMARGHRCDECEIGCSENSKDEGVKEKNGSNNKLCK